MSDKLIQTLQRIVERPDGIEATRADGHEIFFKYKGHLMSILDRRSGYDDADKGRFTVWFYPDCHLSVEELDRLLQSDAPEITMVPYHSADFDDDRPFRNLYSVVQGAHYKIDGVLDQILSS